MKALFIGLLLLSAPAHAALMCVVTAKSGKSVVRAAAQELIDLKGASFEGKKIDLRAYMDSRGSVEAQVTDSDSGLQYLGLTGTITDHGLHLYIAGSAGGLVGSGDYLHFSCHKIN